MAFCDPVLEVTWHHFCHSLMVRAVTGPAKVQGRGHRPNPTMGRVPENSWLLCTPAMECRSFTFSLNPSGTQGNNLGSV